MYAAGYLAPIRLLEGLAQWDGNCHTWGECYDKAQAIMGTGRSGTQSVGSGANESSQGRLFGGDDIWVKNISDKYGLTLQKSEERYLRQEKQHVQRLLSYERQCHSLGSSRIANCTVEYDTYFARFNSSENTGWILVQQSSPAYSIRFLKILLVEFGCWGT